MQGTPKVCKISNVIVGGQQYKQIWIPSYILWTSHAQDIYTQTFIDCGADINCIDYGFAKRNKIPLKKLEKPLLVNNIDRSLNKAGTIKHLAILFIWMGGIIHKEEFYAIKCGKDNIILGLPLLNRVNPTINWVNKHIDILEATDQTEEYNLATSSKPFTIRKATQEPLTYPELLPWEHEKEEPIYPDINFVNYVRGAQYVYTRGIKRFQMINGKLRLLTVAKTSIASKLAQKAEEIQVTLPKEYTKYAEVFSEEASKKMPPSRPYDHPILLDETFIPKIGKVYPLSPKEQKATDNFIEENLRTGKIRPSSSPQASSFFYVGKKDSGLRPCQDYRYINEHTIKDAYLLPLISDLINMVKDTTIFTKFNIWSRYNNIRIKEGDQWKAAFITSKGLFEPTVMFFGLSNSPATFQRFMNNSFKDMIAKGWLIVYMDDMLITTANEQENIERTKRVLQRMKELDLHLKLKKCKFGVKEVDILGLILWPGEITMDPTKLSGIAEWPIPTKVKDIQSFLGFTNYYRWFIGDYSNIARPLIDLIKKNQEWKWSPSCQKAFDQLKEEFLKQPVLSLPDLNKPFTIATDASKDASGGILLQADSNGEWHPCSYLSQLFSPTEWNYDIYDRELLAVIRGLKTWKHYLRGSPFLVKVFTDHKNLLYFKEPQKLNRRQARWMLDISDYDLKLIHVPGWELAGCDALSARPDLKQQWQQSNNPPPRITVCKYHWPCHCRQSGKILWKRPSCPKNTPSYGWRPSYPVQIKT